MKFHYGEWLMRPGVKTYNCEQIRQVRLSEDGREVYLFAAAKCSIPCIWWDNGAVHTDGENFGLIDRRSTAVYGESESVWQRLMDG